jgi:hypothetical protein
MTLPQLHILLPERLQRFIPAARRGFAFGIPALDRVLPLGLPRGQITAFDAPLGSGGTALLLALAETTLRADEGVAFVDAGRTLAPQAAAHLGGLGPFWVIRPRGTESAWWCADVLLRTGAFGLVVVDQAPAPGRAVAVRLQCLARDKDAALVVREVTGRPDVQTPRRPATTAEGREGRERRPDAGRSGAGREEQGDAGRRPAPCDGRSPPFPRDAAPATAGKGPRFRDAAPPLVGDAWPGPSERQAAAPTIFGASMRLCVRASSSGFIPAVPGSGAAWPGPRTVRVTIEKGGAPRAAEVSVGAPLPHRLRPHWAVRDRRGEPTGGRRSLSGRGQRQRAAQPDWPAR